MATACGRRSHATTSIASDFDGNSGSMSSRAARTPLPRPCKRMADLQRRVIAFLEGRRTAELADLIERHNGVPLAAPCLREVHSPDSPVLQNSITAALAADVSVFIFLTGVGKTTVFESARRMDREADLRQKLADALVVVRGPKPTAVL